MTLTRLREIAEFHSDMSDRATDLQRAALASEQKEMSEKFRALAFSHHNAAEDLGRFADSLKAATELLHNFQQ